MRHTPFFLQEPQSIAHGGSCAVSRLPEKGFRLPGRMFFILVSS
jgi:hypothetical protein